MKHYNVLKIVYTKQIDRHRGEFFDVSWEVIGTADSMEEAKSLHPCPVLEKRA